MKPGYLTTEFWISKVGTILMLLTAFGVISQQDTTSLGGAATSITTGIAAFAAGAFTIYNYVKGRVEQKKLLAIK